MSDEAKKNTCDECGKEISAGHRLCANCEYKELALAKEQLEG